ncbi:hypothetical protein [Butyrivibrio sp. M55]|uniref:hypothetical protein n=1 Tax=Butyrivibrio sp. M55 TaxID=1855323 RepID=UPI0008F25618|nr:hypothetical protein [Butyrivibrio sp. M55]SFU94544.1 hypothetical protein SAMN05216540_12529 [Butyrivibrio sp. M55]
MKIGCTRCPHAGHIELKECVDAYTEVAEHCGAYNHNELDEKIDQEPVSNTPRNMAQGLLLKKWTTAISGGISRDTKALHV